MDTRLTEEQIKNWRKVLVAMLGPYALIMSEDEIQKFHGKIQADIAKAAPRAQSQTPNAKGY